MQAAKAEAVAAKEAAEAAKVATAVDGAAEEREGPHGATDVRVAELESQLAVATSAHASKVRELMACQEILATTKSELLNLQLAAEDAATSSAGAPDATSAGKLKLPFGGKLPFGKK